MRLVWKGWRSVYHLVGERCNSLCLLFQVAVHLEVSLTGQASVERSTPNPVDVRGLELDLRSEIHFEAAHAEEDLVRIDHQGIGTIEEGESRCCLRSGEHHSYIDIRNI